MLLVVSAEESVHTHYTGCVGHYIQSINQAVNCKVEHLNLEVQGDGID